MRARVVGFTFVSAVVLSCAGCIAHDTGPLRGRPRPASSGKPKPAPGFNPFHKSMRKLRDGMTRSEAYRILGEPQSVVTTASRQKWRYGHPKRLQLVLTFIDGRLRRWGFDD